MNADILPELSCGNSLAGKSPNLRVFGNGEQDVLSIVAGVSVDDRYPCCRC